MRNRIKPNQLKFKQRSVFHYRKKWLIGLLGMLGIILIWQGYRFLNLKPSVNDLPDYAANMKRADWNEYTKIGQTMSELTKGWAYSKSALSDKQIRTFEQKISEESLGAQTAQIKQLFDEEEAFRKAGLDKTLELYRNKLHLEMERELNDEIVRLKSHYQKELTKQEFNNKKAIDQYNEELVAKHQITLANLQLQLLLVDLSNHVKEPALEKQKIQRQIDKIHQEMYDKLSIRQQQLSEKLAQAKKQNQMLLDAEIAGIRNQLAKTAENALNNYCKLLEADFHQWRQQRQQDIQMVINLRESRL